MLIVVDKVREIYINGQWYNIDFWDHPTVIDYVHLSDSELTIYDSFDKAYESCVPGVRAGKTLFGKKRLDIRAAEKYITKKNFKSMMYQVRYVEHPEWSLQYLLDEMPHEDFLKLVKDKLKQEK